MHNYILNNTFIIISLLGRSLILPSSSKKPEIPDRGSNSSGRINPSLVSLIYIRYKFENIKI